MDLQNGLMEPEIVTFVRSEHQPVAREAYGIAISIFRRVDDFYSGHGLSSLAANSYRTITPIATALAMSIKKADTSGKMMKALAQAP